MLVSVKQLKQETNQDAVVEKLIADGFTNESLNAPPPGKTKSTPLVSREDNLEKRRQMLSAKALEPVDFAYERAIGKNDSIYSNFVELLAAAKQKVGRIAIIKNGKRDGYATGFMVSEQLLLTNWHVFAEAGDAAESEVHFHYEYDPQGHPRSPVIFKLSPQVFFSSCKELDYCFVAVARADVSEKVSLAEIGYLYLDKGLGKLGDVNVERLNIIHHPQGDYKQISIRENLFKDISSDKIYYETDTAPGSSGSPVLNDQWQVVGLHHKSIAKMSPDGKHYLDKNGNIIPERDDKIDISLVVWLKNEGIRISVIVDHFLENNPGNAIAASISTPPGGSETLPASIPEQHNNYPTNKPMENNSNKSITVQVPLEALQQNNTISINISTGKSAAAETVTATGEKFASLLMERTTKLEKEMNVDYSKCRGYSPSFLGFDIPLPQPTKELAKQAAYLKTGKMELKYFKYSVIFNAVKGMPIISAVNVEGNPQKRLDKRDRNDDWLRDKRIDLECQLDDSFYAGSGFDKGHMSRFEDANWDESEDVDIENRNGVYTCMHTNACPQVPDLNRAGGVWGQLEKAILEKGIKKEEGRLARMTVFNGPIFIKSKDRVRKGIVVPMNFYKIILWINDAGKLRATAFKLSQELLVDDSQFDEALRTEEALDIDQNIAFKAYQCSIKSLGTLTKIDFKHIEKHDTFKAKVNGEEETLIESEKEIVV